MLARIFVSDIYSHGLPIVVVETLKAIDPFIAGHLARWVLNAYSLVVATRSWLHIGYYLLSSYITCDLLIQRKILLFSSLI
ncbi:hypothetical protein IEQ34_006313 [Dendrobium chrysotoxum]|uniref:Uncharacterized protein n=1 Tax=Dendrobium chrysotoxum TaxID=161865 RepID=A0AAV7HDI5_DENCH|nr:hypothetical protein IEQ34_006313 [Dendrobium chrysotoxum]